MSPRVPIPRVIIPARAMRSIINPKLRGKGCQARVNEDGDNIKIVSRIAFMILKSKRDHRKIMVPRKGLEPSLPYEN
jgi:hypothetical protein